MPEVPTSVVIVGGGLAGAKTAEALRDNGFDGRITLVSAESELPYERPPLSKGYLAGDAPFDDAIVLPQQWYVDHDIELRLGTRVTSVDRDAKQVVLDDGGQLPYGALVLATGSEPRRLPMSGAEGALTLRTHADSDAIRATFGEGKKLVIIGAGWIGLEVAAAARNAGTEVTIVEAAEQPLLAVLGSEIATVFADLHRAHGVDLRLGAKISEILVENGTATGVRLADGTQISGDAVIMGVGARPLTELAEAAGLDVDDGVLVDAGLRSSDPAIYAVGDIASHDHPVFGHRIRVEHWATALNQPATAAAGIAGDADAEYTEPPYFFSDQYGLGMEYIGHAGPGLRVVVRGDLDAREFVAFWLDGDDRLHAVMNVNVWDVPDAVKPFLGKQVDPERLADPNVAFGELA